MAFKLRQKIINTLKKKDKVLNPKKYYSTASYSQCGEDVCLFSMLETEYLPPYKGFFIDIGALHPLRFSNTQFFYDRGWKGINIDATPGSMIEFNKRRPLDINIEAGITDKNDELFYYMFKEPALNSFNEEMAKINIENGWELLEKRKIKTYSINEILDKYLPADQKIDFINIDTEGHELEILKSFNFEKYAPNFFLIEDLKFGEDSTEYQFSDIYKLLKTNGYKPIARPNITVIWKKQKEEKEEK